MEQLLIDIKKQCPVIKDFVLKLFPDPNTRLLTGIYKISFKEDKKRRTYIGSAVQDKPCGKAKSRKGFYGRFYYHIYDLRRNTHHSPKLQNYVNKYGILGMSVDILEFCDKTISKKKEEGYIIQYNAVKNGFNCSYEGKTNGTPLSAETRAIISKKVSAALKGRIPKNWESIKGMRAKIVEELENGIVIKQYKSPTEMCKVNNFSYKHFSLILLGKQKLPSKYGSKVWRYKV